VIEDGFIDLTSDERDKNNVSKIPDCESHSNLSSSILESLNLEEEEELGRFLRIQSLPIFCSDDTFNDYLYEISSYLPFEITGDNDIERIKEWLVKIYESNLVFFENDSVLVWSEDLIYQANELQIVQMLQDIIPFIQNLRIINSPHICFLI
jgi:hypothetical protein